jgi:hypothetical protein
MPIVEGIRYGNKFFIPAVISSLVASDQQDRTAARIEGKEHSIGPSRMLYPKFFHIRMARRVNEVRMGTWKSRAHFLKQDHLGVHVHLFSFAQPIPPAGKLVCIFNLPFHRRNIAYRLYFVKGGTRESSAYGRACGPCKSPYSRGLLGKGTARIDGKVHAAAASQKLEPAERGIDGPVIRHHFNQPQSQPASVATTPEVSVAEAARQARIAKAVREGKEKAERDNPPRHSGSAAAVAGKDSGRAAWNRI